MWMNQINKVCVCHSFSRRVFAFMDEMLTLLHSWLRDLTMECVERKPGDEVHTLKIYEIINMLCL